jgi:O-antigen/teichoic acid export membrane protein
VLYKELKFKYLSVLNLSVNALKFIVVCTLAFTGWGVWAIVAGLIVKSTAKTIGFVIATKSIFRPAWYFNYLSIKEDVRFGVYQTGESLVNLLHQRVDTLIIGKFLGLEVLGVYDLMKNILMKVYKMINPIFTTVSIPMLARVKDESRKTIALYLEQIQMLSFFNFPIYILLLFYDELFFDFFLKPEWERQGYHLAFGLLDIFYLLSSILNPIGSLVIAHGAVRSSFRYNLMVAVLLPTILLMLAALGGGLAILVLAMVIFQVLMVIVSFKWLIQPILGISYQIYQRSFLIQLILSSLVIAIAYLAMYSLIKHGIFYLMLAVLLSSFMYLLATYMFNKDVILMLKRFVTVRTVKE